MYIGERVKQLRNELGLTQVEFGKRIGTSGATISTTESGKTTPDNQTILLICKTFGVNQEWLLTGEGPKHPEDLPDSPGALSADLAAIFAQYPAINAVAQRVIPVMTPDVLAQLNALLDRVMGTKKEAPED